MNIGYLFPGQGAQYAGMGKDLCEASAAAGKIFERADAFLDDSLRELCFRGPEERLTQTIYAHPALFVMSAAALEVLRERLPHLKPTLCAGLSLGEFSALYAAGALSFEDALRLVQKRAEAMEYSAERHPGTMASILGLSQEACTVLAREAGCELANFNAPDQFVLSGTVSSIDRACRLAQARGAKRAIPLKVGGAFHSGLMKEATQRLERALEETPIREPECLFIPNVTGKPVSEPSEIRRLLADQLMSPVQWIETMRQAKAKGVLQFLELGPGKVLKGLARRCDIDLSVEPCGTVADFQNLISLYQNASSC